MSGSSINQSKNVQMKTANLPPSWEIFSTLDVGRQQTIYRTMCEQITQQQKQVAILNEKIKQNELLASQKIDEAQNKLFEDTLKIKSELERYQNEINTKDQLLQKLNEELSHKSLEIQMLKQELQNQQEFIEENKKAQQIDQQNNELKQQLDNKEESINNLRAQVQQLLDTLNHYENEMEEQTTRYQQELEQLNQRIEQLENELGLANSQRDRLQAEYETLSDRLNNNKDFKQFENMYQQLMVEFQQIKNNYMAYVNKVKDQEITIEDLVAENSRLVIELYNHKV